LTGGLRACVLLYTDGQSGSCWPSEHSMSQITPDYRAASRIAGLDEGRASKRASLGSMGGGLASDRADLGLPVSHAIVEH
jgi:hypothetical protein